MGKKINNKGIAVIYLAITIIVLIAFIGLSVDIGYMYVAKGQLQNAADAAAQILLAQQTRSLCIKVKRGRQVIQKIADANGLVIASKITLVRCPPRVKVNKP
jgi:Flp pilus assembly protein TadG